MKPRCSDESTGLPAPAHPVRSSEEGVVVAAVQRRTAAATAGLAPGDRILAINGAPLRDAIDFQFHAGDERLDLTVVRDGALTALVLDRRGRDLGLELAPPRPSEIATCANKCVFCFIHQLPRGMRRSLYVKDDDFRLSFLHGNYITLTDLEEAELERIEAQHLSPLYISVHATDPALRHELLGRPRVSTEILPRLRRLARAGIRMHAQIVLCPDLNDGSHLERTVAELAPLHPHVATTAVVPVGLTRHRERLPRLRALTPPEARRLVETATGWQTRFLATLGSRFVFLADEIYLLAGVPLPPADAYEGFAVAEDGIGLVRRFEDEFTRGRGHVRRPERARTLTVVTGELYGPRLSRLLSPLAAHGVDARVAAVPNDFFGRAIAVAGLLTGRDIQRHLAALPDLGEEILVPAVALRDGDHVFLDDLSPADVATDLGVPVRVVETSARALLAALRRPRRSHARPDIDVARKSL
jgi:putative radical SAM enzyme (TIGR03279 family)